MFGLATAPFPVTLAAVTVAAVEVAVILSSVRIWT